MSLSFQEIQNKLKLNINMNAYNKDDVVKENF